MYCVTGIPYTPCVFWLLVVFGWFAEGLKDAVEEFHWNVKCRFRNVEFEMECEIKVALKIVPDAAAVPNLNGRHSSLDTEYKSTGVLFRSPE